MTNQTDPLDALVGELMGVATLCWVPTPTGVLDTEQLQHHRDAYIVKIQAAINAEIAKAKAGSVTPQTPNPQPFDNASGGVIPEGVALLPITPGQKLHILEGFRNRIEKILLHNVTKIEQEYPLQDGSYSIGYVSADLLWAELGRIKQKIRNVQEYQAEKSIERHQRTDGGQDE